MLEEPHFGAFTGKPVCTQTAGGAGSESKQFEFVTQPSAALSGDRRNPCPGPQGRPKTGPSPVDRRKPGSKHHVITDAGGIPLAVSLTGGNRHDVTQLMPGYDFDKYRRELRAKGITPVIARRGTGHGSGLGTRRWVVEQTIALLHWFRRLRIRWEIRDDIHEAFLTLAIICWRRLQHSKS
jgi:transposase